MRIIQRVKLTKSEEICKLRKAINNSMDIEEQEVGKFDYHGTHYSILFNEKQQMFSLSINGFEARLSYSEREGVWNFYRTFTPPQLRGNGIAAVITKAGLDEARKRGHKIIPSCSYVRLYIDQHPEYQDLL